MIDPLLLLIAIGAMAKRVNAGARFRFAQPRHPVGTKCCYRLSCDVFFNSIGGAVCGGVPETTVT
jgi:hypothetical protein